MNRFLCLTLAGLFLIQAVPAFCVMVETNFVTNERKLDGLKEYFQRHSGENTFALKNPTMIVVHFTALEGFQKCVDYFAMDDMEADRPELVAQGRVNVGIHYLVSRAGRVMMLYPDTVRARHVIGFNHTAIGIENAAWNSARLTPLQLEANAALIARIREKNPGIRYLIGHEEYMLSNRPHFAEYRQLAPDYKPVKKDDPGLDFMSRLRALLKEKYHLEFQD